MTVPRYIEATSRENGEGRNYNFSYGCKNINHKTRKNRLHHLKVSNLCSIILQPKSNWNFLVRDSFLKILAPWRPPPLPLEELLFSEGLNFLFFFWFPLLENYERKHRQRLWRDTSIVLLPPPEIAVSIIHSLLLFCSVAPAGSFRKDRGKEYRNWKFEPKKKKKEWKKKSFGLWVNKQNIL